MGAITSHTHAPSLSLCYKALSGYSERQLQLNECNRLPKVIVIIEIIIKFLSTGPHGGSNHQWCCKRDALWSSSPRARTTKGTLLPANHAMRSSLCAMAGAKPTSPSLVTTNCPSLSVLRRRTRYIPRVSLTRKSATVILFLWMP